MQHSFGVIAIIYYIKGNEIQENINCQFEYNVQVNLVLSKSKGSEKILSGYPKFDISKM